jgi:hypothetical protein
MGLIEGSRERRNFHDSKGGHLFPHPETYARRSEWTAWDRDYAKHLDRHRELIANPEPMKGDPQIVTDLFAHIEHLRAIISKEQQLITALRQKAAEGAETDDRDTDEIRRIIRTEEGS